MALVDVPVGNMIQNNEGNGVRRGRRGRGLRGGRGPGGTVRGARKLDGHPCRGPPGLRGVRGPGGRFSGVRKLTGHLRRGPLGMRRVRGPGGRFSGVRKLTGHRRRGPLGMRRVRGPGSVFRAARWLDEHVGGSPPGQKSVRGPRGAFRGSRRLDGAPRRGPLGMRGERGPGGIFRGVRQLDGHPCRGPLGSKGVGGPGGTFRDARRLDGHRCRRPLGMRGVRGPGGTFSGARQLDGHPRRGPLSIYATTKTMHGTRNLPRQNHVLEDLLKAVASSGVESGTKLQVSNLNAGVSKEDIRTPFSEVGELIHYGIHYDKDGKPCGSAEVVFARTSDAFQAVKRYNNSDLDGKPMKTEKVGSIVRAHVASRLNMIAGENGRRPTRLMSGSVYIRGASILNNGATQMARGGAPIRGRGGRGRGRGRGHGGFGVRAVEKSTEELDKELENYQAETRQT